MTIAEFDRGAVRLHDASARPRGKEDDMFSIIGWIVFGLVVGVIAKVLMPGKDPGGIVITAFIGIAGALIAGFLGRFLGMYGAGDSAGYLMSILGAVLLLFGYRHFRPHPA